MNNRWKMNRIGFVNFWLYDEEDFEFEDGKLLLRGQNGSGKSITTQSFIPSYWMATVRRADWIHLAPVTGGWNTIFWERKAETRRPAICFWSLKKKIQKNIGPSVSDRKRSAANPWISGGLSFWMVGGSAMISGFIRKWDEYQNSP